MHFIYQFLARPLVGAVPIHFIQLKQFLWVKSISIHIRSKCNLAQLYCISFLMLFENICWCDKPNKVGAVNQFPRKTRYKKNGGVSIGIETNLPVYRYRSICVGCSILKHHTVPIDSLVEAGHVSSCLLFPFFVCLLPFCTYYNINNTFFCIRMCLFRFVFWNG